MSKFKKIAIALSYSIFVFFLIKYNASILVEWLNKSLFVDYIADIELDKINSSFFNGESFIFFFTLLFYALFGTLIVGLIVTNLLIGALIFANQVKVKERNEFITFKELQTITSPKELLSFIEVSLSIAVLILISIILMLYLLQTLIKKLSNKIGFTINVKTRVTILLLSFIPLLFIYLAPNMYNQHVLKFEEQDVHNWNPVTRAQTDGFLPTFIHTINPNYMDKPNQYNKNYIRNLEENYLNVANNINETREKDVNNTQTILYLSETLMDPMNIPNLLKNKTPLQYMTSIKESNPGGTMYSQYIGGGTANIEWSLLTSFSLELFNDPMSVTPYSDFYVQSKNHHTFLNYFEKEKVALHPYSAHLYKRRSVYDTIGFDDFLYLDNGIKHTEKIGTHTRVSDEALHKDLLRVLSNKNVGLTHVLTMQNHSPFSGEIPDMAYIPEINLDIYPEEKEKGLTNYLQGLRASDEAVKKLIENIEASEEEINLLLYGDHFPSLFRGLEENFPGDQLHLTPWFLYMNHGRDGEQLNIEGVSPMFLTTILLKEGDYKVTPFHGLLTKLFDKGVKRIAKDFVVTDEGQVAINELDNETQLLIEDYQLVVYDALFGSNYLSEDFFTKY